jgi:hypothetical protein
VSVVIVNDHRANLGKGAWIVNDPHQPFPGLGYQIDGHGNDGQLLSDGF